MRISVTNVDGYRYYQQNEAMTLDQVLARLRHEEPPSPAMIAGRAFHSILEDSDGEELDVVERDGILFEFNLDAEIALPEIRELKAEYPITVDGVPVVLVGKIDALNGRRVDDHKLTGQFSAERYADAFQWRAYLHIFGASQFRYNVFTGSQLKDGTWRVRAFDTLEFWRYPGLEADVMRMLTDYVRFAREYMPETLQAAA